MKQDPGPLSLSNYNGIYLMVEKVKRDKNRVDIKKLDGQGAQGRPGFQSCASPA